ncbi:MAG: hypothetical protein ABL974_19740 [Prosthecobacter sp.]
MRPVGGGGGEDGAGVRVEAEAGGTGAADLPFLIPLDVVGVLAVSISFTARGQALKHVPRSRASQR